MELSRNLIPRFALANFRTARISTPHRRCLNQAVTTAHRPTSSNILTSTLAAAFRSKPSYFQSLSRTRLRYDSTASTPLTLSTEPSKPTSPIDQPSSSEREVAAYEITFTCKPCKHRSAHRISKQGYHQGTVLITCPECKNRHVISDHLKIFSDKSVTIEDLLRDKGEFLQRGTLGADGDVEFWDNGTGTHTVSKASGPGGDRRY